MLTGASPVPALRPENVFTPSSLATPGPSSDWNSTDGSAGWFATSRGVLSNRSVVRDQSTVSNYSVLGNQSRSGTDLSGRTVSIEVDDLVRSTGM
jgi:hypothetical protein